MTLTLSATHVPSGARLHRSEPVHINHPPTGPAAPLIHVPTPDAIIAGETTITLFTPAPSWSPFLTGLRLVLCPVLPQACG